MGNSRRAAFAAVMMIVLGGCASFSGLFASATPAKSTSRAVNAQSDYTAPRPLTLLYTTFQDHAVLQRDKPIPLWGLTSPRAIVTVVLGGETASATADATGKWQVVLAPLAAGGPYTVTARSNDGKSQTINDIMIGDVFLCSGQSNMEMPVSVASNYNADISGATNTNIRLFHVQRFPSAMPRDTFGADATWSLTSPATVTDFSATCYNFGKNLQPIVQVPVGLIEDAWGGSVIQAWLSADKVRDLGGYDPYLDLLSVYAASPKQAELKWREIAQAWWLAHDPASSSVPAWRDPAYDDSSWARIVPTGTWREWNVPALKEFNGVVWLRETIELSADQAKGAAVLSLGAIDQSDTSWVNGVEVGDGQGYDVKRNYDIPAGTLHAGKNLIAVGVLGGAGILASADQMTLKLATGSIVRLTTPWRYKLSAPMDKTGTIANIPWLNQFGLTVLYNGMIRPLGPTQLRAVVWYQGESNASEPQEYGRLLPALIDDWHRRLGADLPFIVVQLPNFGPQKTNPDESNWAMMREVQRTVAGNTPNTGLVVTIDIGQSDNIHPTNKQELGRRIALVAQRLAYGMDVVDSGPTPIAAIRKRNVVTIPFAHIGQALTVLASNRPIGFQICDVRKQCRYVDAIQNGNEIDLDVSHIDQAVSVHYCWADSPICNVYNSAGLPAGPFEIPIKQVGPAQKHAAQAGAAHRRYKHHRNQRR
jgi:sialate O-acetylesterase